MHLLLFLLLITLAPLSAKPLPLKTTAEAAILMDADSGAILYEKNSRRSMAPASVTKIATVLYALKLHGNSLDERVLITKDMISTTTEHAKKKSGYKLPPHLQEVGGTHMHLKENEVVPLKDLFYGVMLASANEASNAIAIHCGGTVEKFMQGTNAYLREIGCTQTTYYNPHGLYYPDHKTTAYDLALMTREALKIPIFRQITATTSYTKGQTNLQPPFTFYQGNKLLRPGPYYYSKAIGVKTGYIKASGHNLVGAATYNGRTFIAVVMKCKERKDIFVEAQKMFEAGFNETLEERIAVEGGLQKFDLALKGAKKPVGALLEKNLTYTCYPSEDLQVKCLLVWDQVALPIEKGQRIGELRLATAEGKVLNKAPLYAHESVEATLFHKFIEAVSNLWNKHPALVILATLLFAAALVVTARRYTGRR